MPYMSNQRRWLIMRVGGKIVNGEDVILDKKALDIISVWRYNISGGIVMIINNLLEERNLTKYRLSKMSGVPHTTINDICNGRVRIEKCSVETLYKLAGVLGVSLDYLVADALDYRASFETYKSSVCHKVKDMGDMGFIIDILESDEIRRLYQKRWYP